MDALIRKTVESKDPKLANAMDMLEATYGVEFHLEYGIAAVVMGLSAPPNFQAMTLDSSDGLPSYFAEYLVGGNAPAEFRILDCARMFTKDAYFTFRETETSLKMKMQLRGKA